MASMDVAKFFQKKSDQGKRGSGKGQKPPTRVKKAEPSRKAVRKADENQASWLDKFRQYLREVVYELRRVVWPSRKETLGTTSVVLVIVILCGIFLGIVDLILSRLIRVVIG